MWYCPTCQIWVGWKLDECLAGHDRPRFPVYVDDVEIEHSRDVTTGHRLRAKLRGLLAELGRGS